QTLLELGADQNSTVVFPLPMDIIGPLMNAIEQVAPPTDTRDSEGEDEQTSDARGLSVVDDRAEGETRLPTPPTSLAVPDAPCGRCPHRLSTGSLLSGWAAVSSTRWSV